MNTNGTLITLLTDFGEGSPYVAQMKGVIHALNSSVRLVDITHSVPPQDVRQGAVVLSDVVDSFPDDTIHIVVVDPGVGSRRRIVCAGIGKQRFIAPDNGLLSALVDRLPTDFVFELNRPQYWRQPVSATFHGRDIMAPVAAHLSLGMDVAEMGDPLEQLVLLDWPAPKLTDRSIAGHVRQIDLFGNIISDISAALLQRAPADPPWRVTFADGTVAPFVQWYDQAAAGQLVALMGSNGCLEVAVVNGNAAQQFNARVGDAIQVEW